MKQIKNFNLFKESLLNKLTGPSKEEIIKNNSPESLLSLALKENDMDLFDIALSSKPYIDNSEEYLFYAFHNKNDEMVIKLLNYGFNVNGMILCSVAQSDNMEIIKLGCKNFIENKNDMIYFAVSYGNVEMVKYLIDEGYDVNYRDDLLKKAIQVQNTEIVSLLIDNGVNISRNDLEHAKKEYNFWGSTLIIKAYKKMYEGIVHKNSPQFDYIVYFSIDGGPNSELEKVYEFLIDNGVRFPYGDTQIYPDDLHKKYILIETKKQEMTYNSRNYSENYKEIIFDYLVETDAITENDSVYVVKDFNDLKSLYNPKNINNYFDRKLVYESLLDSLEGPTEKEAIEGLNDKFANGELKSEEYFEKLIENGFIDQLDEFLYGYDYDYETVNYGLYIAIDYKRYDVIEYFLDLGINKSDIEIQLKEKNLDENIKILLQKYLNKKKI